MFTLVETSDREVSLSEISLHGVEFLFDEWTLSCDESSRLKSHLTVEEKHCFIFHATVKRKPSVHNAKASNNKVEE